MHMLNTSNSMGGQRINSVSLLSSSYRAVFQRCPSLSCFLIDLQAYRLIDLQAYVCIYVYSLKNQYV